MVVFLLCPMSCFISFMVAKAAAAKWEHRGTVPTSSWQSVGAASWGEGEAPCFHSYFRVAEGRNGLQLQWPPLWRLILLYMFAQQMGWGGKVASKEQTPPRVGNVHESEAAGVRWARPPTRHPLLARKRTGSVLISDSQLKVSVDVCLSGSFRCILTPIPIMHADMVGAGKASSTAHLSPFPLAHIISWGTLKCKNPTPNFRQAWMLPAAASAATDHWLIPCECFFFSLSVCKGLPQTLRLGELLLQQDDSLLLQQTLDWIGNPSCLDSNRDLCT